MNCTFWNGDRLNAVVIRDRGLHGQSTTSPIFVSNCSLNASQVVYKVGTMDARVIRYGSVISQASWCVPDFHSPSSFWASLILSRFARAAFRFSA